jgi:hypothetical protein
VALSRCSPTEMSPLWKPGGGVPSTSIYPKEVEVMTTKVCTRCHQEKPVSDFGKSSRHKSGYNYSCKKCQAKYMREKYQSDPVFRRKRLDGNSRYLKLKYETDPEYKKKEDKRASEYSKRRWRERHPVARAVAVTPICRIIQRHHRIVKDDPERLSTDFLQQLLVGVV